MNYKVSCCPVSCVISCFVHVIKLDETMDLFSEKKKKKPTKWEMILRYSSKYKNEIVLQLMQSKLSL